MKKELFDDGVLELELSEKKIDELIDKLVLLKKGEDHVRFNINKYSQLLMKKIDAGNFEF